MPHRRTTAGCPYPTMRLPALASLPIDALAAPNAILFMWILDSHMEQALQLGRAWGFRYKTVAFTWVKTLRSEPETPVMSLGYWTRPETEQCLLFARGRPKRLSGAVRQLIVAPRREHSRKPDEQYSRIEQLVGGPYLEMFARHSRPGWTAWGNDTDRYEPSAPQALAAAGGGAVDAA